MHLVACIDPSNPFAPSLTARVRRSITPSEGKNFQDRRSRQRLRDRFEASISAYDGEPLASMLPFSLKNASTPGAFVGRIEAARLNRVVAKWARGLHFYAENEPLKAEAAIEVIFQTDENLKEALLPLLPHGALVVGGPGIKAMRWSARENGKRCDLYAFEIWDDFRVCASVDCDE